MSDVLPFEWVGTSRCDVPARVQRAERTSLGPRCAAERGADGAAHRPYLWATRPSRNGSWRNFNGETSDSENAIKNAQKRWEKNCGRNSYPTWIKSSVVPPLRRLTVHQGRLKCVHSPHHLRQWDEKPSQTRNGIFSGLHPRNPKPWILGFGLPAKGSHINNVQRQQHLRP